QGLWINAVTWTGGGHGPRTRRRCASGNIVDTVRSTAAGLVEKLIQSAQATARATRAQLDLHAVDRVHRTFVTKVVPGRSRRMSMRAGWGLVRIVQHDRPRFGRHEMKVIGVLRVSACLVALAMVSSSCGGNASESKVKDSVSAICPEGCVEVHWTECTPC